MYDIDVVLAVGVNNSIDVNTCVVYVVVVDAYYVIVIVLRC